MFKYISISEKRPIIQSNKVSWKDKISNIRIIIGLLCVLGVALVAGSIVYIVTRGSSKGDPQSSLTQYDVEKDYLDIQCMIDKAKEGIFDETVWNILDEKPYIINAIPENSTYSLLHYAVLYNNTEAVHRLVNYSSCDVKVKSIPSVNNKGLGGKIPENLASTDEIRKYLHAYTEEKMRERFGQKPTFFATKVKGEKHNKYGLPLLLVTISSYKKTFFGNKTIDPFSHFKFLLEDAFKSSTLNLQNIENEIINSLYGFDAGAAKRLKSKSEDGFYGKLINLYTSIYIHDKVNLALKREALFNYSKYRPRSVELHMGPYALMLDSVLTYWDKLKPYNNVTYRGGRSNITSHYHDNMTFVFLEFLSSTDNKRIAENFAGYNGSVFIMNNEKETHWQPRNIAEYSEFPAESEFLYPPGAEFTVTKIDGRYIYLDLEVPGYP